MNILIILGTDREGAYSRLAANLVLKVGEENYPDLKIEFADPSELDFSYNKNDDKYSNMVENADGFFIVTPEYNHGYPGTLKTLLDTEFSKYKDKPVVVAGVSDGAWGGTRVIEALSPVLRTLGLRQTKVDLHFVKVDKLFDDNGNLLDKDMIDRIKKSYDELIRLVEKGD